ncbi:MAG: hypothetical protein QW303_04900, partial [Nitrososphaerota archaeon]
MEREKKDIIIVGEDYPGKGGFGTYSYNLYKQMNHKKYKIALLYFSQTETLENIPPDEKEVYSIFIPDFYPSIDLIIREDPEARNIENNIRENLKNHCLEEAHLIISISPRTLVLTNKFIKSKYHIYRLGHVHYKRLWNISNIWELNLDNFEDLVKQDYYTDSIMKNNPNISILPNSPLAEIFIQILKTKLGLQNKIYSNLIGLSYNPNETRT